MSARIKPPEIKGWCPGALRPMQSGDGLVVRVRPPLAQLTPAQATGLADLAMAHGSGILQLTNRANLQLRGIAGAELTALQDGLAALGLLDLSLDAAAEARLNILVAPVWQRTDMPLLWTQLRAALIAADAPVLPGKFGFALDAGEGGRQLAGESADIRIETAEQGLILRADGAALGRRVSGAQAVAGAMALARWFVASGGVGADGRGRMRDHLARGATLPPELAGDTPTGPVAALPPQMVGFDFGLIGATVLRDLATHAPDGLRLTPWRAFYLPTLIGADRLRAIPDLVLESDDPRQRRFACTGAPGCPQALGQTRALAQRLGLLPPPGRSLHIAGCAKGCAHPGPADLVLTFTESGLCLIRNGRAGDPGTPVTTDTMLLHHFREWTDAPHI